MAMKRVRDILKKIQQQIEQLNSDYVVIMIEYDAKTKQDSAYVSGTEIRLVRSSNKDFETWCADVVQDLKAAYAAKYNRFIAGNITLNAATAQKQAAKEAA